MTSGVADLWDHRRPMRHFPVTSRVPSGALAARSARAVLGTAIIALAASLVVKAQLGLGPWNVVQQGLSRQLDITLGQATWLTGVAFLMCAVALGERPGPGTALTMFFGGLFIDAFLPLVEVPEGMAGRLVAVGVALVMMSLGGSLVISARLGTSPLDAVNLGMCRKIGPSWSLATVRLTMEIAGLAIGWWLGGQVGVGCVIIGLGIGPCLQLWLRVLGHSSSPETGAIAGDRALSPSGP